MRTKLIVVALILPLVVVGCKRPDETMATTKPAMASAAPAKVAEPAAQAEVPKVAQAAEAAPAEQTQQAAAAPAAAETAAAEPAPVAETPKAAPVAETPKAEAMVEEPKPMAEAPKPVADTTAIAEAPMATAVVNGTATAACESTRIASIQEYRDTIGDRVFFHYDKSEISADGHATLQCQAKWLSKNPAAKVTVEGHADERGTREYNLALGERRSNEVKNYLISLGVDGAQLNTISYGKERPEVNGSNEAAWQQNRRAVTVPAGLQ